MTHLELKIIARLRELQNGAEPANRNHGICHDLRDFFEWTANDVLRDVFVAMGLDPAWPIGEDFNYGHYRVNIWSGPRGVERRAFAGRVADFMEGKG